MALKYEEYVKSGMAKEQAKILTESWCEAMELHPEAASKEDLENLREEIMYHLRKSVFEVPT